MEFSHFSYEERLQIEIMLKTNTPIYKIANALNKNISSIYREIENGNKKGKKASEGGKSLYKAEISQTKYFFKIKKRRNKDMKKKKNLCLFIKKLIIEEKYSPDAALARAREIYKKEDLICLRTLYSYIENGNIDGLDPSYLPQQRKKKNKEPKKRVRNRRIKKKSISDRPETVNFRSEFGHWEMDTVLSSKSDKTCLLVLTERKTRMELIFRMLKNRAKYVVYNLDLLESTLGNDFYTIFKSITVDNGKEFEKTTEMEQSLYGFKPKRFTTYYAHPYSSYERGSNENTNKLIRRHYPKGFNFSRSTKSDINYLQNWINQYPRKILSYDSSWSKFKKELHILNVSHSTITYFNSE